MASAAVSDVRSATDAAYPLRVHIRPAECTVYLVIYGKFAIAIGSMWASTPTSFFRRNRKSGQKDALGAHGAYCLSMTVSTRIEYCDQHTNVTSPHRTTRRLYRTALSMELAAMQEPE